MTWSYSITQPQSTKDLVRLLVKDTDASDPLLQDEEITSLMVLESGDATQNVNTYRVAAEAARTIAAAFGRLGVQSDGELAVQYNIRAADYRARADQLRTRSRTGALPFAGGISVAQKESVAGNSDRVAPMFERTMLDAPGIPTGAMQVPDADSALAMVEE